MAQFTKDGLEKMKNELQELKDVKRKEVSERLRSAAAQGDLSENFEYSSARDEQEMVERRIGELEILVKEAVVVSETPSGDSVQVGSRVEVDIEGEATEYIIAGAQEADPMQGKISVESPIGRALLGKKLGDRVEVETPAGKMQYTIKRLL